MVKTKSLALLLRSIKFFRQTSWFGFLNIQKFFLPSRNVIGTIAGSTNETTIEKIVKRVLLKRDLSTVESLVQFNLLGH